MSMTLRTKAKLSENLGLLVEYFEKKFGQPLDDADKMVLFNALDWTAEDVEKQDEERFKATPDPRGPEITD